MRFFSILAFLGIAGGLATAEDVPIDSVTGMKMTGDWEIVRNHCIICHSPKTFLQQHGTESNWADILAWMQKHGGLWKLNPAVEKTIIGYLAANYGPGDKFRRAPIPLSLMPANPYATDARLEAEEKKKAGLIPATAPTGK